MNTKIINLFGGPGSGKSTNAAGLFYQLKIQHIKCELVTEVAKDFTWEERWGTLACQPYVFGKQLMRLERLLGKVDYIITDSPIFLSAVYNEKYPFFSRSVAEIFKSMNNVNFVLQRNKPYFRDGRNQTEEEAQNIDHNIIHELGFYQIPYKIVNNHLEIYHAVWPELSVQNI